MLFFFTKIPLFSRKMISFASISANPCCQMSTEHGRGFPRNSDQGHPTAKQGIKGISNLSLFKDLLYPEQWQWQESTASELALGQEQDQGSGRE